MNGEFSVSHGGTIVDLHGRVSYSARCLNCYWVYILELNGSPMCRYCNRPLEMQIGTAYEIDISVMIDQNAWVTKNRACLTEQQMNEFLEENKQRVIADFLL